ncbi:MAG: peptidylprolyl isomerase [Pseudomonadota bacterium]
MKTVSLLRALALGAALAFSAPAFSQDSKVVAKVGEKSITQADLDQAMKDLAQQFANFPEAERKARALDSLIDIYVLSQKAESAGMDDEAVMKSRLDLLRARALHNAWFQGEIQPSITDEALKARFDAEVAKAPRQQEVSARHILVKTEEEAKAIIKELEGGADFVELAKAKSTGPSGPKGGDLGYFTKGRMVPAFEKAAFDMEKGAFTKEPVKTQFGFHVIKVEDKRDTPLPKFEAAKNQIQQIMLAEAYAEAVQKAREEAGAEVLDDSLKLPAK